MEPLYFLLCLKKKRVRIIIIVTQLKFQNYTTIITAL